MKNYNREETQENSPKNINESDWRDGNKSELPINENEQKLSLSSSTSEEIPQLSKTQEDNRQKWWDSPEFKIGLEKILAEASSSKNEESTSKDENEEKSFIHFPEELVKSYKSKYPYFYSYIKNDFKKYLLGSEKIKKALLKYSVGMLTPEKIEESASLGLKNGPKIEIVKFSNPNQNGEYFFKDNTIKLSENLIQQYESILSDPKSSNNKKLAISISLNQVLINEFTHYGDALDGIDAIQDSNGEIVNNLTPGEGLEGNMTSKFDEGNEAVAEIFEFYGADEMTGLQNLIIHTTGTYLDPSTGSPVGKDISKIDPSLIPPIPTLDTQKK